MGRHTKNSIYQRMKNSGQNTYGAKATTLDVIGLTLQKLHRVRYYEIGSRLGCCRPTGLPPLTISRELLRSRVIPIT